MIVNHRPQDAGKPTEYTMALDRAEFILLHELVKAKAQEFESSREAMHSGGLSLYALLRAMGHDMQSASIEPIPLPETLRRIAMSPLGQDPPSIRNLPGRVKRFRKKIDFKDTIPYEED